jgi:hypothetical protein
MLYRSLKKTQLGLNVVPIEGRESKYLSVARYSRNTTFQGDGSRLSTIQPYNFFICIHAEKVLFRTLNISYLKFRLKDSL